jgi:hypothetical protein
LTVIGVTRTIPAGRSCPPGTVLIPSSLRSLVDQTNTNADRHCREAVRGVALDVPVDYGVLCGRPHAVIDAQLTSGEFVAVVVSGPWTSRRRMRRAARRWRDMGVAVHAAWG